MTEPVPPARKPYTPPRLLQVQRREAGDNLTTGCKNAVAAGPGDDIACSNVAPCDQDSPS